MVNLNRSKRFSFINYASAREEAQWQNQENVFPVRIQSKFVTCEAPKKGQCLSETVTLI